MKHCVTGDVFKNTSLQMEVTYETDNPTFSSNNVSQAPSHSEEYCLDGFMQGYYQVRPECGNFIYICFSLFRLKREKMPQKEGGPTSGNALTVVFLGFKLFKYHFNIAR